MELGMIGLGRMGGPMAQRLTRGGHRVAGLARNPDALRQLEEMNIVPAASFDELVNSLKPPRIVWLMIPAGAPVACRVKKQAVCVSWSFAAAKVRFPTDGSLDRSQSSRRVFPKCERIPVRRYEPMKRRVTLACRLH